MKLSCLFNKAIELGIEKDPRKNKKKIRNFADSNILFGSPDTEIKKVMVGIDIEVAELLLADRLRARRGLDLVISHHPEGSSYARLYQVMELQLQVLKNAGVEESVAKRFLDERMREVERKVLPQNHSRPVDAARLLNIPFICLHTPADNHAFQFVNRLLGKERPKKVKDIIDILIAEPEYRLAEKQSCGPKIILGNPRNSVGKILVEMTGGTEGPKEVFDRLYKKGVRTLVSMHLSEEHFKKAKDAKLNAIIAGHISSDTLGLNLLLDRLESATGEKLEIIGCSGFNRFSRQ